MVVLGRLRKGKRLWHCSDCFRYGLDVVLPSATQSTEARRLQGFNREPKDRTLLLTWHGEHAESDVREDVRQGRWLLASEMVPKELFGRGSWARLSLERELFGVPGYRDVNETVRVEIIKTFRSRRDASVGRPSMRYGFLMGNAHFCLIPRGPSIPIHKNILCAEVGGGGLLDSTRRSMPAASQCC